MGRVQKMMLLPHPETARPAMHLGCKITLVGTDVLKLDYVLSGAIGEVLLPTPDIPERRDGLWQHTCFETFISFDGGYAEFNFSPSRSYAVYRFESYREGMQPALDWPSPHIYQERDKERFALTAWIDLKPLASKGVGTIGLSAVIEEANGTKSYWALAHGRGAPDFHNSDCFIARVPAPDG